MSSDGGEYSPARGEIRREVQRLHDVDEPVPDEDADNLAIAAYAEEPTNAMMVSSGFRHECHRRNDRACEADRFAAVRSSPTGPSRSAA